MPNRGEFGELVNAQNLKLEIGADRYIQLQELNFHLGRPENREPTTDGGVIYYYGKGDHAFDCVILLTTPEITAFNADTELNASGDMTSRAYKIVATPRGGGANITMTVNAVLYDMNIEKPIEGGVLFRLRFRITDDTITVA